MENLRNNLVINDLPKKNVNIISILGTQIKKVLSKKICEGNFSISELESFELMENELKSYVKKIDDIREYKNNCFKQGILDNTPNDFFVQIYKMFFDGNRDFLESFYLIDNELKKLRILGKKGKSGGLYTRPAPIEEEMYSNIKGKMNSLIGVMDDIKRYRMESTKDILNRVKFDELYNGYFKGKESSKKTLSYNELYDKLLSDKKRWMKYKK